MLGNLVHVMRSHDFNTYPQHNIRLNNHLRVDAWLSLLLALMLLAFPRHLFSLNVSRRHFYSSPPPKKVAGSTLTPRGTCAIVHKQNPEQNWIKFCMVVGILAIHLGRFWRPSIKEFWGGPLHHKLLSSSLQLSCTTMQACDEQLRFPVCCIYDCIGAEII